jgi:hypothetical protein
MLFCVIQGTIFSQGDKDHYNYWYKRFSEPFRRAKDVLAYISDSLQGKGLISNALA